MKNNIFLIFLILFSNFAEAQISPDAGLVIPFSKTAKLSVSSGSQKELLRDGNLNSFWESENPLPNNFISSREQNFFLNSENFEVEGNQNAYLLAFDGSTDSQANFKKGETIIKLFASDKIKFLALKFNIQENLSLKFIFKDGSVIEKSYSTNKNYQLQSIQINNNTSLKEIRLNSIADYQIFELAAINSEIEEWVSLDFQKQVEIAYLQSRHLNGEGVISIEVLYSNNLKDWKKLCDMNPQAVASIPILIEPDIYARYLKIRFVLKPLPYNKAVLREFSVYDKNGPFGEKANAKPANNPWNESIGVNAIWGWGYGISSALLKNDAGSVKFAKIGGLARSYHRLDWDINKPGATPDFVRRENNSDSLLNKWLNWKDEYGIWKANSLKTDACILFNNEYFPEEKWSMPYVQAKRYAMDFGNYFINKNNQISLVEIGNEPWAYSKTIYMEILKGMSDGLKKVAPNLPVLPCGLQAFEKHALNNNYLPDYLGSDVKIDGLNTHIYSYIMDEEGNRVAINPEDARSETWSVNNLKVWAKANNYSENIYVTEFGYDSDGGGDECTHSNCVSELEQAIYGLRQAMIFYRLGVKQFYWYFYANVDWISILHNRSGLVSSHKKGFQEKLSFKTFEYVKQEMGELYFKDVVVENKETYCYSFSDENGNLKAFVAWRPTSENHKNTKWVELPISVNIQDIKMLTNTKEKVAYKREIKKLKIALSGIPVIVLVR
jgi:hypothetical protein